MMSCDRCRCYLIFLERVIRRDNDGLIKIDTRLCKTCLFETGLFSQVVLPEIVEQEIFEEEVVLEESHTDSGKAVEAN
jgi:hypothetical protein